MEAIVRMEMPAGKDSMQNWFLSHKYAASLQYSLVHGQPQGYLSYASTRDSDHSSDEEPDSCSSSSRSSSSNPLHMVPVPQLEGLFQIPKKHLLPGMMNCMAGSKEQPAYLAVGMVRAMSPPPSTATAHSSKSSQTSFTSFGSTRERLQKPVAYRGQFQQLTSSVISIRGTWAALEASRGVNNWHTCAQLVHELAGLISIDGCTLFQYHVSHLLEGGNHAFRMKKLWISLAAGQKTYWRKHSARFQIPLAYDHWQVALRNLETDNHGECYSTLVRKARNIVESASYDAEGHLIANPNWRKPVPERELQLWRLDQFAATKKLERRVQSFQGCFGQRRQGLYRKLGTFIDKAGWTMFVYHGVPRVEETEEGEVMAKLKAIWNGMTADDRLYWRDLSCRLIEGLRSSLLESLVYFSFDAWAVKEARQSAEAWVRLQG